MNEIDELQFKSDVRLLLKRKLKMYKKAHYFSLVITLLPVFLLMYKIFELNLFFDMKYLGLLIYFLIAYFLGLYGITEWKKVFMYYDNNEYLLSVKQFNKILYLNIFINPTLLLFCYLVYKGYNGPLNLIKCDNLFKKRKKLFSKKVVLSVRYTKYLVFLLTTDYKFENEKIKKYNDRINETNAKHDFNKAYRSSLIKQFFVVFIVFLFTIGSAFVIYVEDDIIEILKFFLGLIIFHNGLFVFLFDYLFINQIKKAINNEEYLLAHIDIGFWFFAGEQRVVSPHPYFKKVGKKFYEEYSKL